jgi:signal peptidase II
MVDSLSWFRLHFIENPGMAGLGISAVIGVKSANIVSPRRDDIQYLVPGQNSQRHYSRGFIVCAALIYAGALGNLIDSMFYGLIFEESTPSHVAAMFHGHGYAGFLHGRVVDMLYFPMIRSHYPSWFPFVGGDDFEFFSPIFNVADASISVGVITLLVFQKRFFKKHKDEKNSAIETNTEVTDKMQVL